MVKNHKNQESSEEPQQQESLLLKELLTTAQKQDSLDGMSLQKRLEKILDLRIKNEVRILKLIDSGLVYVLDGVEVVSDKAVALHKSHKDSLTELIKVHRLLCDLSTENINLYTSEEKEELSRLRGDIYGRG